MFKNSGATPTRSSFSNVSAAADFLNSYIPSPLQQIAYENENRDEQYHHQYQYNTDRIEETTSDPEPSDTLSLLFTETRQERVSLSSSSSSQQLPPPPPPRLSSSTLFVDMPSVDSNILNSLMPTNSSELNTINAVMKHTELLNYNVKNELRCLEQNKEQQTNNEDNNNNNNNNNSNDDDDNDNNDDDNNVNGRKRKYEINRKNRQKYKKTMINSDVSYEQALMRSEKNIISTIASSFNINQYFSHDFTPYLQQFEDDGNNSMSCGRFVEHITETGYYMFVVKRATAAAGSTKKFEIIFAKYVVNVAHEYTANYYMVDTRVFIVTFDRVRFMISYDLIKECGIHIPPSEDFDEEAKRNVLKKCYFMEVYSFNFKRELTVRFNLDLYYCQTKMVTMMQCMGENKTGFMLKKMYDMFMDRSLFTLPIMLSRTAAATPTVIESTTTATTAANTMTMIMSENEKKSTFVVSPYIKQILKHSEGMKFKMAPAPSETPMDELTATLGKCSLTIKYNSIAGLLYKTTDSNLKKVKKEDGSAYLVEQYLTQNESLPDAHNFIVLTFKNEERLTIVKREKEYFWILPEIKNLDALQMAHKFSEKEGVVHHMFFIEKANRRESNSAHNKLIKIVALIVQNVVALSVSITFVERNLPCVYKIIKTHH
jgi:hypothetical protein